MNPITPEDLKQQEKVQIPTPIQDTTDYSSIVASSSNSVIDEYNRLNENLTRKENAQDASGNDILNLMGELTGKTAFTQQAEQQAGVQTETEAQNKLVEQLAGLNAQATSLNREAQAIPIQVQEQFKNTGATDRGVAPITTGRLRENALRALSIAQQSDVAAAALTGSQLRLQSAKDKAQQMVDLKYKPLEDALAIKKQQYDLNKDILERADKKRAEALNLAIKKEERMLDDLKEKEKVMENFKITLATNQAPTSLLEKARNAKSLDEIMVIPGISKYLQSPLERLQYAKTSEELRQLQNQSTSEGLTVKQRESLLKDKTSLQASARIGIINAIKDYQTKFNTLASRGVLGKKARAELNAALNTTIGSAINVAQGQGAMGDEEAKRIMGGLRVGNFNSSGKINSAIKGVIDAQSSLLENDFATIDSGIPGATDSFELFKNYKVSNLTDDEFFSEPSDIEVDNQNYFEF